MNARAVLSDWRNWLGRVALAMLMAMSSAPGHSHAPVDAEDAGDGRRNPSAPGTIRIWASPEDRPLLEALQAWFKRVHPHVAFRNELHGPESAFSGVYTGVADVALLSRELREPLERMAYEWVKLSKPFLVNVANAGLGNDRQGVQLAVVVNARNPLRAMTLAQLDAVLGAERRRGGQPITSWGALNPSVLDPDAAIRVYGPRIDSIPAQFVRRVVMRDSRKWTPGYREMEIDWGGIVDAISADPHGLGYVPVPHVDGRVRAVALGNDLDEAVLPTRADVVDGRYPLRRTISMAVAHTQAQPMSAHTAAFLGFVLSPQGQSILEAEGSYLPLSPRDASEQTARLRMPVATFSRTDDADGTLARTGARVPLDMALPPSYRPESQVTGKIRIWGHGSYGAHTDFVEGLTRAWQVGFRKYQPGIVFENRLHGTASAIGALYAGVGDLAFLGREIWAPEIDAFREVRGYEPTGIDVMTGSYDVRNKGYAIAVFVHKDNPVERLDMAQLEAVYGLDRKRGHGVVRTWGDLGLGGTWRDKPVHPHGLPIARGFADYFQEAVFLGGRKWRPDLREFADEPGSRGGETDGGHKMLQAIAQDPLAIGYAGMLYHHPDVKAIALAPQSEGAAVEPTLRTVADRTYPLTRTITMFVDREPSKPLDPKVREFLRYILSREGQQDVLDHGHGYLPVPVRIAEQEVLKLD